MTAIHHRLLNLHVSGMPSVQTYLAYQAYVATVRAFVAVII
jgi:hypothetical protein